MSYEFTVTYDHEWKCISVVFPGAPPQIPEAQPLPEGQLIKIASLGQAVLTWDESLHGIHYPDCPWRLIHVPVPDPPGGKKLEIIFNGDGAVVRFSIQKIEIASEKPVPLASAGLQEVKKIKPLGELLIFKLSDGKFIRCVQYNGLIVTSPPSDE